MQKSLKSFSNYGNIKLKGENIILWEKGINYYFNGEWWQNNILLENGGKLLFLWRMVENNILLENGEKLLFYSNGGKLLFYLKCRQKVS